MPLLLIPLAGAVLLGAAGSFWRDVTGQNNSGGVSLPVLLLLGGGAYLLLRKAR